MQPILAQTAQQGHEGRSPHRLSHEEEEALTSMILSLVDEPLVLAVKLADRLHNMRTCHVLKPDRRTAVATETLQVWCGLAERLGMFSLKVRGRAHLAFLQLSICSLTSQVSAAVGNWHRAESIASSEGWGYCAGLAYRSRG